MRATKPTEMTVEPKGSMAESRPSQSTSISHSPTGRSNSMAALRADPTRRATSPVTKRELTNAAVSPQLGPWPSLPGVVVSGALLRGPSVQGGGFGQTAKTVSDTPPRKPTTAARPKDKASNHPTSPTYPPSRRKFASEPIVT